MSWFSTSDVRRRSMKNKFVVLGLLLFAATVAHAQQMAITFDDLPAHGDKPAAATRLGIAQSILATLKQEHMPPTYGFINGTRPEADASSPAVLEAWRAAGQPLGNHTWSHQDLNNETPEQFEAQITQVEPLLKHLMGAKDWHWLRYPYLHEGDTLAKRRAVRAWLAAHRYRIAEVTMDFGDYLWNPPYARCMDKHDDAAIGRLHDSYLAAANQYYDLFRQLSQMVYGRDVKYVLLMHVGAFNTKMLPELLALYRSKGVRFISLPAAMSDPAYRDDPDIGAPGGTLLDLMMQKNKLAIPANSKPVEELDRVPVAAGRALTLGDVGALSDLDDIAVRIADVAANLAVLGDRRRDELRTSAFP